MNPEFLVTLNRLAKESDNEEIRTLARILAALVSRMTDSGNLESNRRALENL